MSEHRIEFLIKPRGQTRLVTLAMTIAAEDTHPLALRSMAKEIRALLELKIVEKELIVHVRDYPVNKEHSHDA